MKITNHKNKIDFSTLSAGAAASSGINFSNLIKQIMSTSSSTSSDDSTTYSDITGVSTSSSTDSTTDSSLDITAMQSQLGIMPPPPPPLSEEDIATALTNAVSAGTLTEAEKTALLEKLKNKEKLTSAEMKELMQAIMAYLPKPNIVADSSSDSTTADTSAAENISGIGGTMRMPLPPRLSKEAVETALTNAVTAGDITEAQKTALLEKLKNRQLGPEEMQALMQGLMAYLPKSDTTSSASSSTADTTTNDDVTSTTTETVAS